jgi:hypothetical protein
MERLKAVLEAYAFIAHDRRGQHDTELGAFLHRDPHLAHAGDQLLSLIGEVPAEAAAAGGVRSDVSATEPAAYCVNALQAAGTLPSKPAVRRLVTVTLDGLCP